MTEDPDRPGRVHDLQQTGPVDYLVLELPGNRMTGEAFATLLTLVDRELIRVLDLAFVRQEPDGATLPLDLSDVDVDADLDLTVLDGASSGLLDVVDLEAAAAVLEPGHSAGVLVYENVWALPFETLLRRGGAQLVARGRIPV